MSNWPDWVRNYQTLLGAVIAFVGVSWTLYWNAKAGRRLERFKGDQQRIALLAALRAELAVIQSLLSRPLLDLFTSVHSTASRGSEAKGVLYPSLPRPVFEKNVDKIGMLGVSLSATVVIAYAEIAQLEAIVAPQSTGKDIDCDVASFSAARAFSATGRAIHEIKVSLPKKEQHDLIMFSQPEVWPKDIEFFWSTRKRCGPNESVNRRVVQQPTVKCGPVPEASGNCAFGQIQLPVCTLGTDIS